MVAMRRWRVCPAGAVFVLLIILSAGCGKKAPKVPLESVDVGGISVGMTRQDVANKTGCKWEAFTASGFGGANSLVCRDGELRLDLRTFGLNAQVGAAVKAYTNNPDKVTGFTIQLDLPPMISQDTLVEALTKHYTEVIGMAPEMKGNTPNWDFRGKAFFIQPDSENARVVLATFPLY